MDLTIKSCARLQGTIAVPGDKSISHRAVMLGALATGVTEIHNFLMAEDCLTTIKCLEALGTTVKYENNVVTVQGKGLFGFQEPEDVLDCGNSGTTTRLMMGILAGQPFSSTIIGDESLRSRPMGRVITPLSQMGANFIGRKNNTLLPITVRGQQLKALTYNTPVASAQLKSAILLAGLYADGITTVREPVQSRNHTELMLRFFDANIETDGLTTTIMGQPLLKGGKVIVPGDISSAAFIMVAAAIVPDSDVIISNVGINPTRDGVIEVLQAMGADITVYNLRQQSGEPIADLRIRGGLLKGIDIGGDIIPRLIDEIPILAVAASVAQGKTTFKDAAELRLKETDRIVVMAQELTKFGVKVEETPDGMVITGGKPLMGTVCSSYGDHRIAMALAIVGLVASGQTKIMGADSINISFPGFRNVLNSLLVE
jgi:3-phosphoshikimate 1-carboxyvinyltransferase